MDKNLLLIYPPKKILANQYNQGVLGDISLAILYLAGAARNVCDNIRIFDMGLAKNSIDTLDDSLHDESPSVVAVNCLFSAVFPQVKEIAKHIKSLRPDIKVIVGGMHPTIFAEEIIRNCPEIDAAMLGEGDLSFPKLLQYYWGELPLEKLDSVVLRVDGQVVSYPKISYIEDLDTLPMPAYDLIDFDDYRQDVSRWYNPKKIDIYPTVVPILTSRSCPNQCNFCAMRLVMGDKIRFRSAESVLAEIKHLYYDYGINYFKIIDDNFAINRKRTVDILRGIIDSGMNIYIECINGLMIRTLDAELIALFAQVGTPVMQLAMESGSDYIRNKIMHKNVSKEKVLEVLGLCKQHKIVTYVYFLIGMPEETEATLNETLSFIRHADFDFYALNLIKPYPGTAIFEQAKRDSMFTKNIKGLQSMWSGDFFSEEEGFVKQEAYIKPYAMSAERLLYWYDFLKNVLDQKCRVWIEHRRQSTKLMK